ncbi:hypothetical protein F3J24_17125 [Comamonas sp. Tr-654]|uniref:hypothetical protein n=1 Tax=Comamonas sp. Tr-654 TaxID=2608341 RepID=UPI00141D8454|nr:hypothetical protein [Comamonas sp. Tr-654]NIF85236.1 hypothetical protein [Comamonas sp. Tr-654]
MTHRNQASTLAPHSDQDLALSRRSFLKVGGLALGSGFAMSAFGQMGLGGLGGQHAQDGSHRFVVGEYLKFRRYRDGSGVVQTAKGYLDEAWFESLGMLPINLIYSNRFLDGDGPTATLNENKLRSIANEANPAYPVSLDAEAWDKNRFRPDAPTPNGVSIVQNLVQIVRTFKQANPSIQVGLYGEVPQNTYGINNSTTSVFDRLNPKYASVAAEVDYYSPSLYNYDAYDGTSAGDQRWAQAAEYAVHSCKQLDAINRTNKPILAYITPGWADADKTQRYLTEEQMHFRLTTLKKLGAGGCIVWLSSSAQEPGTNDRLILDPNSGWLKATVEFARNNK